jgi:hypothetical protein
VFESEVRDIFYNYNENQYHIPISVASHFLGTYCELLAIITSDDDFPKLENLSENLLRNPAKTDGFLANY